MSNSSADTGYLTSSQLHALDTISISSSPYLTDTITIDSSAWANYSSTVGTGLGSITITGSGTSTCYTIGGAGSTCYTTAGAGASGTISGIVDIGNMFGEDFENRFPDFDRIKQMCKEYPGLQIAFEKFKTVYKLVKDDYDTPKDKRPRP